MKSKLLMFGLSAALAAPTMADVTINVTGATAFRQAALLAIEDLYTTVRYAHDGTAGNFDKSSECTFIGTVPGISGTTTIRTAFNGSVEGVRAVTSSDIADQPLFIPAASVPAGTGETAIGINGSEQAFADFSFSDVSVTSTPFAASPVYPGPDSSVGVVVFSMVTNDGSPIENVTSQNFRALFANGFQQAKLFTGDAADTSIVVASGRNDGSGTRTTYLAETGYGITELVNQYVVAASSGDENTEWALTEAGSANASTVWGQDLDGNGGYSSGSLLRSVLGRKGTNCDVTIYGGVLFDNVKVDTVSFLSLSDAVSARGTSSNTGAKIIAYNGVRLDDVATFPNSLMSAADLAKITEGAYTAWGNQQFYGRDGITGDKATFFTAMTAPTGIESNLGTAGVPLGSMNVSRPEDGGVVAP